jgi:hypothetical protein
LGGPGGNISRKERKERKEKLSFPEGAPTSWGIGRAAAVSEA